MASITHIVANEVLIGDRRLRQRCAWCGAVLIDMDLANVAAPAEPCSHCCEQGPPGDGDLCPHCDGTGVEPFVPATYPVGRLVRVTGTFPVIYETLDEVDRLPDDACGKIDDEVTAR